MPLTVLVSPLVEPLTPFAGPVEPELPVFPLPAVPVVDACVDADPVLPPVLELDVVVLPVFPVLAVPEFCAEALPELPPVEVPLTVPLSPVAAVTRTPPLPPADPPPEPPVALASPVPPEAGLLIASPPSPLTATDIGIDAASPELPDPPPVAVEVVVLSPLVAVLVDTPVVVASPELPLSPADPLETVVVVVVVPEPPVSANAGEATNMIKPLGTAIAAPTMILRMLRLGMMSKPLDI